MMVFFFPAKHLLKHVRDMFNSLFLSLFSLASVLLITCLALQHNLGVVTTF